MDKQENKQGVLSFNRSTGCYEGMLLVQVDAEIFRRMLLLAIEEDEAADLTDPQTWMRAIECVGKATYWIGRPHVKVTPVTHQTKLEEQKVEPAPKAGGGRGARHCKLIRANTASKSAIDTTVPMGRDAPYTAF